ncbi:MAG: hypothetical protein HQM08_08355 [Candidatus Riflebacteria bacterium]|nr:hypothetical protein [Candidatus Riflebacteria bacterium]
MKKKKLLEKKFFFLFFLIGYFLLFGHISPTFCGEEYSTIFKGHFGPGESDVGIKFLTPDILPETPFCGPGGFFPDKEERIWISDSIQKKLKAFSASESFSIEIPAKKLGDLCIKNGQVFLCTKDPDCIMIIDIQSKKVKRTIPLNYNTPRRILVVDENHLAVEETDGNCWIIFNGIPELHPAQVIEAVGNTEKLFGISNTFENDSRNIVYCGWEKEKNDPEIFSHLKLPENRIVFSKVMGYSETNESLMVGCVLASQPNSLSVISFDSNGAQKELGSLPLQESIYLPSQWVFANGNSFYGLSATATEFKIIKKKMKFQK